MNLSSIEVKGFYVHDFVKWLAIHQITFIEKMTISDYILSNDHCMDVYQEDCSCREEIIETLRGLHIKHLTLRDVNLNYPTTSSPRWNPIPIERLELVNYVHHENENENDNTENREWISSMENLQDLSILHDYNQYQVSYMPPSQKLLLTGIRNPQLKSIRTNICYFKDDLKCLLQNSVQNENLKLFSFEDFFDEDQAELFSLIKSKFPRCLITRH